MALRAASQLEQKDTESQIYSLATEMRQECVPPPPTLHVHFIYCAYEGFVFCFFFSLRVLQRAFKRWPKGTSGPAIFGWDNRRLIGDNAAVSWFPLL